MIYLWELGVNLPTSVSDAANQQGDVSIKRSESSEFEVEESVLYSVAPGIFAPEHDLESSHLTKRGRAQVRFGLRKSKGDDIKPRKPLRGNLIVYPHETEAHYLLVVATYLYKQVNLISHSMLLREANGRGCRNLILKMSVSLQNGIIYFSCSLYS